MGDMEEEGFVFSAEAEEELAGMHADADGNGIADCMEGDPFASSENKEGKDKKNPPPTPQEKLKKLKEKLAAKEKRRAVLKNEIDRIRKEIPIVEREAFNLRVQEALADAKATGDMDAAFARAGISIDDLCEVMGK